jgi:hypothetical protein
MESLAFLARRLFQGLWVALLPAPERQRFARRHQLDAPLWSLFLGLFQGGLGLVLFFVGGLAFTRGVSADLSRALLENWEPGLSTTHFRATGMIGWLAWLIWPASWPRSYLALVGLGRCVTFVITRDAFGEPLLLFALRGLQRVARGREASRREAELGPLRSDRLSRNGDEAVVVTCRPKPGWDEAVTVEIEDRYYRLSAVEERQEGGWKSIVYRLREQDPTSAIRRLVRYRIQPADRPSTRSPENGSGGRKTP